MLALVLATLAYAEPLVIARGDLAATLTPISAIFGGSLAVGGNTDTARDVEALAGTGLSATLIRSSDTGAVSEMEAFIGASAIRCGVVVTAASADRLALARVGECGDRPAPSAPAPAPTLIDPRTVLAAATALPAPAPAGPVSSPAGPTLRFEQIADGRPDSIEPMFLGAYVSQSGIAVKVGDVLRLVGATGSGSYTTARNPTVGPVTATTVNASWFTTVYNGTYSATMGKLAIAPTQPALYMAPASLAGTEVRVVRMKLGGTKKRPAVWAECEFVASKDKANASGVITLADIDDALRSGEVVAK